ncbi:MULTISPECIES: DUF29 family protein [Sphaerospermopsis]|jgi:hypothetical protein|uniref:DUF29 domain-containing protein n=2 Tax=Sphaerospermopsis TaxID=752201 RepID=A0A479ZV58_9CYAN|nr:MULTISPECIES: DUF29 family protein [Sphaerospermopsis]MBD2133817.1 DUF29 family protein [Sphaerospermopsis sp. FACHB-1094]MBD2144135.1 DUF29 family protein [Sphaerospermopsis sp. FACHB-1194]MBE9235154.1 DUF29 family protein [Sphaerospermopsis aphanizomenoides LEGE 00250]GCL36559.1 hypothetical protein SR1949_16630 [Sphaerospermopsis reniformis]
MEELLELRELVITGNLEAALNLIDELEEMSKEDKINKIYSYCVILLVHLIKQHSEKRTTNSWDVSIRNATDAIIRVNKRRKAGGYYLHKEELEEILLQAYDRALDNAALEAFGGIYDGLTLQKMIDQELIIKQALDFIF